MSEKRIIIGCEEWCALPELGLPVIKARVDSGAKTSCLHAYNITPVEQNGEMFIRFDIHPIQGNRHLVKTCQAKVVDRRDVKSSSGHMEKRYVIRTPLTLGHETWEIELTLTNRDSMGYRMLLGREAMRHPILVDPNKSFYLHKLSDDAAKAYYCTENTMNKKGLNIIVLASNPDLYSNKRLIEAGEQRGHNMRFINIEYCYMNISTSNPQVYYRGGELLDNVDAVIPRIRPAITFYGNAVLRQFEMQKRVYVLNDTVAITRSRDKLRSLQLLSRKSIPLPTTSFASSPQDTKELMRMVGGAPLIVKLLEGTQGKGVVLAETNKAAESVINAFKSLKANILVQQFVKEAGGRDIRCFVVDGKVVGAMQRIAMEGEFRANLHLGGQASTVKITSEEKKMAVRAAKVMGLQVAGVDIIRSDTGPKVLEINSSPGLEGIEGVTGKDIAGLMIECIENNIAAVGKPAATSKFV